MSLRDQLLLLARYILPQELFDYFDLTDVCEDNNVLHLYLDEDATIPDEYQSLSLEPNGFYAESLIRDFPLRDRKVMLHVRRRRWLDKSTGKSFSRSWELTADGTRYTKEFASFLKGMLGFIPDYGPLS